MDDYFTNPVVATLIHLFNMFIQLFNLMQSSIYWLRNIGLINSGTKFISQVFQLSCRKLYTGIA